MIHVTGRYAAHCPVYPLFKVTSASTHIFQLNYEHLTFTETGSLNEGKFSPPVGCCRMGEEMVIHISDKLVVTHPVKSANSHRISPIIYQSYCGYIKRMRTDCQIRQSISLIPGWSDSDHKETRAGRNDATAVHQENLEERTSVFISQGKVMAGERLTGGK